MRVIGSGGKWWHVKKSREILVHSGGSEKEGFLELESASGRREGEESQRRPSVPRRDGEMCYISALRRHGEDGDACKPFNSRTRLQV